MVVLQVNMYHTVCLLYVGFGQECAFAPLPDEVSDMGMVMLHAPVSVNLLVEFVLCMITDSKCHSSCVEIPAAHRSGVVYGCV